MGVCWCLVVVGSFGPTRGSMRHVLFAKYGVIDSLKIESVALLLGLNLSLAEFLVFDKNSAPWSVSFCRVGAYPPKHLIA